MEDMFKRELGEVSLTFGSGLYDDEEFFEVGRTYDVMITVPPGFDKEGVVLMIGPTRCGFITEATSDIAKSYLRHGLPVRVEVTERHGLSDPKYSKKLDIWQKWGSGVGRCSAGVPRSETVPISVRVDLGQVKVEFGTGEFDPDAEECFVVGPCYRLVKSEIEPGKTGVAVELLSGEKRCGWVTPATAKKALRALENKAGVCINVTQIDEGKQGEWDAKLRINRNWWHGVAKCWYDHR